MPGFLVFAMTFLSLYLDACAINSAEFSLINPRLPLSAKQEMDHWSMQSMISSSSAISRTQCYSVFQTRYDTKPHTSNYHYIILLIQLFLTATGLSILIRITVCGLKSIFSCHALNENHHCHLWFGGYQLQEVSSHRHLSSETNSCCGRQILFGVLWWGNKGSSSLSALLTNTPPSSYA